MHGDSGALGCSLLVLFAACHALLLLVLLSRRAFRHASTRKDIAHTAHDSTLSSRFHHTLKSKTTEKKEVSKNNDDTRELPILELHEAVIPST